MTVKAIFGIEGGRRDLGDLGEMSESSDGAPMVTRPAIFP